MKQQNRSKKDCWSNETWSGWSAEDWSHWNNDENEFRLEVFSSLEELEYNVPPELYEAVSQILRGASDDGVETLDLIASPPLCMMSITQGGGDLVR